MNSRGFDTSSSPRSSSEFEEVNYPPSFNDPFQGEELPLHYMEDRARRRIKGPGGVGLVVHPSSYADDDGKNVYTKIRSDGRHPIVHSRRYPPPPTNIVSL